MATLLPGTAFFLGVAYAPARRLIDAGVTVALASDCNPGTCPTENLPLVGTMACTQMKMLPAEVVDALTLTPPRRWAAADRLGSLDAGQAGRPGRVLTCPIIATSSTTSESTMSGASSSAAAWSSRLEPVVRRPTCRRGPTTRVWASASDFWPGGPVAFCAGRPVLIGFPQDEGVRRNGGRPGAAEAPTRIRHWLYRLTPPVSFSLLDLGNVRVGADLEASQEALAAVVAAVAAAGAIPIVLGGGHETALGHYLGLTCAGGPVGVINLDAHLDVRPTLAGKGHSGSPFRQMMEDAARPLAPDRYVCLGAQPSAVSAAHHQFVTGRGGIVRGAAEVRGQLGRYFREQCERLAGHGCPVYVSLDADVVRAADVPGVSALNPLGLDGVEVCQCLGQAGASTAVAALDVVEINPRFDRDELSARWAALAVWSFLAGLATRPSTPDGDKPLSKEQSVPRAC